MLSERCWLFVISSISRSYTSFLSISFKYFFFSSSLITIDTRCVFSWVDCRVVAIDIVGSWLSNSCDLDLTPVKLNTTFAFSVDSDLLTGLKSSNKRLAEIC